MLTEIRLENFKSFGKLTSIPLARISVFIGPNGSGKSTPIQAALMLKQSIGQIRANTRGAFVQLGPFNELVHKGQAGLSVVDQVWWSEGKPAWQYRAEYRQGVGFGADGTVELKSDELVVALPQQPELLVAELDGPISFSVSLQSFPNSQPHGVPVPFGSTTLRVVPSNKVGVVSESIGLDGPAPRSSLQGLLSKHIFSPATGVFAEFFPVPASRTIQLPELMQAQKPSDNLLFAHNPSVLPGETATAFGHRTDIQRKVSEWCYRVTSRTLRIRIEPNIQVAMEAIDDGLSPNIVNDGFGTNQLVNLFVQLALATRDSVVTIEEPEIHLHPKAQAALTDVLREVAQQEKKQLILTTHSEHILFRLLSAVASGDLKREDLAINYFEKVDGATRVTPLEIDDKGRVKGGLPGFFEAELDELSNFIKALGPKD